MKDIDKVIPNGVESIDGVFYDCENLKTYEGSNDMEGDFSNYKLPDSIIYAGQAFNGCLNIIKAPEIPQNTRDIEMMFYNCTNLVYGPTVIPASTMKAQSAFSGCENLIKAPEFEGDYIESIDCMYEGCSSLKDFLITIPESVESCSDFLNDIGSATGTLRIKTENKIQQIGLDTCEGKVVVYVKANCEAYDCIYAEAHGNPNITIISF
jgi:hypothetical protein